MSDLEITATTVVDSAFRIHRDWGPGLLESFYRNMLVRRLKLAGLAVTQEVPISFEYEGETFRNIFRIDLLVENYLLVELKSVEAILPVHKKQVLTYLRVMQLPLGLLLNMGSAMFRDGAKRIINPRAPQASVVDFKTRADSILNQ